MLVLASTGILLCESRGTHYLILLSDGSASLQSVSYMTASQLGRVKCYWPSSSQLLLYLIRGMFMTILNCLATLEVVQICSLSLMRRSREVKLCIMFDSSWQQWPPSRQADSGFV
jgi:hypothetical protein